MSRYFMPVLLILGFKFLIITKVTLVIKMVIMYSLIMPQYIYSILCFKTTFIPIAYKMSYFPSFSFCIKF